MACVHNLDYPSLTVLPQVRLPPRKKLVKAECLRAIVKTVPTQHQSTGPAFPLNGAMANNRPSVPRSHSQQQQGVFNPRFSLSETTSPSASPVSSTFYPSSSPITTPTPLTFSKAPLHREPSPPRFAGQMRPVAVKVISSPLTVPTATLNSMNWSGIQIPTPVSHSPPSTPMSPSSSSSNPSTPSAFTPSSSSYIPLTSSTSSFSTFTAPHSSAFSQLPTQQVQPVSVPSVDDWLTQFNQYMTLFSTNPLLAQSFLQSHSNDKRSSPTQTLPNFASTIGLPTPATPSFLH